MMYRPPRLLERIAEAVIPPASAEHALGDLAECSRATSGYLRNLVSIVPRLVWCQIRRRATIGGVILNALLSGFALVGAQRIGGGSFLDDPSGLLRLSVSWGIWVAGCALAAAYGPPAKAFRWNVRVFLVTIVAAIGAAAALEVPVLRVAAGLGATYAVSLALSMPFAASGMPPPLSPETLPAHARLFQKGILWRNAREQVVGAALIVANLTSLPSATGIELWAQLLLIAGILFVIGYLFLKAHPRRLPDTTDLRVLRTFHRGELARQRDILRRVPLWYLLPLVPGLLAMTVGRAQTRGAGALGAVLVLALVFGVIWKLNTASATFLDSQLHELDALPVPDTDA